MDQNDEVKSERNIPNKETAVDALARKCEKSILEELLSTKFACTRLTLLPSGTTNYVFRGVLKDPRASATPINDEDNVDGTSDVSKTVIVKHLEGFARLNPALLIDGHRGSFETFMLGKLEKMDYNQTAHHPSSGGDSVSSAADVRAPRLLYVSPSKSTFVLEDFGTGCLNLKEFFLKMAKDNDNNRHASDQTMKEVGKWLRAFHEWTMAPGEREIVTAMQNYSESGEFKRRIAYGSISTYCEKVGILDQETMTLFGQLEELLVRESADHHTKQATAEWGPIHSDFWTGNILIPPEGGSPELPRFSIIDWEFACLAPRAYDLGQMIGDLVELHLLHKSYVFQDSITNFVEGYGALGKGMAFRVLIHAGAHLMGWYVRGPKVQFRADEIQRIVRFGRDMVCFGLKQDEEWFRGNKLGAILDQVEISL